MAWGFGSERASVLSATSVGGHEGLHHLPVRVSTMLAFEVLSPHLRILHIAVLAGMAIIPTMETEGGRGPPLRTEPLTSPRVRMG
jgi:hypothetical protein